MDGKGDDATSPFATRVAGGKPAESSDTASPADDDADLIAPGAIYATASGQRHAVALEFIWKDRRSLTIPYSYLPLLWWQPPDTLAIEYPTLFTVRLKGKELDELHRRIKDHRITWVREFDARQADALSSAVTAIEIIRAYPSRVAGDEVASD